MKLSRLFSFLFLVLLSFFIIVPFIWMFLTSLQPDSSAVLASPYHFPFPPAWRNYWIAWHMEPFGIYTLNSLVVSISCTIFQLASAVLAAYAFIYLPVPGRKVLFSMVLAVLMMPSQVAIIPLYEIMSGFRWLNTYRGLIIPFAVDAYGVFMIYGAFSDIPKDYFDEARLEGSGHLRVAFDILARLATPMLIAYAVLAFKWRWNDYFWVLIMTNEQRMRTMPVGIVMMKEVSDGGTQWHLLMAATLFVIAPMIILYLCLQKYFTNEYQKVA